MKSYFYDIEVYPNLFALTAISEKSEKLSQFVVFEDRDDRKKLLEFLQASPTLIGFNNLNYDDIILAFLLEFGFRQNSKIFLKNTYNLSCKIIFEGNQNEKIKKLKYSQKPFKSIDLSQIKPSSMSRVSLKQIGINLKHHKIQDLPIPFNQEIQPDQLDLILSYNSNDVQITALLYKKLQSKIEMRRGISELYGVDVINETESGIANAILNELYSKATGLSKWDFYNLRTPREKISAKDCIAPNIIFQTQELQELQEYIAKKELFYPEFAYKHAASFAENIFEIGVGGIHSKDGPAIFETDSEYEIIDADVTSYYPNIVLNNRIKPEHLDDKFFDILQSLKNERVEAKKLYKQTKERKYNDKQSALKITINSIFGKFGSEFFWLYDPKCLVQTTLNGQFYLLMLIERLYLAGIQIISANTDGIVCKVARKLKKNYQEVCKQWEIDTNFELEYTIYKKYVRRDVNNYLTLKENGELKLKGCFETEIDLFKGYQYPIVPKALKNYFVDGIKIEDTIKNSEDIYDFMFSQKVGSDFTTVIETIENGKIVYEKLQKNNRFYVTTSGNSRAVKKSGNRVISLKRGEILKKINNVPDCSFDSFSVDYEFYIKEAYKIADQIKPRIIQMSLL